MFCTHLVVFPVVLTARTGILHSLYKVESDKTTWNYLVISEYIWALSSIGMIPLGLIGADLATLHVAIGAMIGLSSLVIALGLRKTKKSAR